MNTNVQINRLAIHPGFDLENFLAMSHESRIGGATLERLETLWEEWQEKLSACIIQAGKISYLAVWLPESVEDSVERAWKAQASEGFLIHCLAQFLCMTVIQDVLPEIEEGGCAPSPRPSETLRQTMAELGIPYKSETSALLSRTYAVLTHYPYKGGCEICHLKEQCPKGSGEESSVLLPGFEQA
ncbi:MAG: hypothetical protein IJU76_14435 [Desulfovibrionaceae bacterium]|nr:hypothetical protein [Desulfovibrionaceae bacterium]